MPAKKTAEQARKDSIARHPLTKAQQKKTPPEKKTAKAPVKKAAVKSTAEPTIVFTKVETVVPEQYIPNLTRLAEKRGRTVDQEVDNAIHDHLEKHGMI